MIIVQLSWPGKLQGQCPTTCNDEHSTLVNLSDVLLCSQGTVSLFGEVDKNTSDCETPTGLDCHEFVFVKPAAWPSLNFTLSVGRGSGCNGNLNAGYVSDGITCTQIAFGGSQTVINFGFPNGQDTVKVYLCINSSSHVTMCDLCVERVDLYAHALLAGAWSQGSSLMRTSLNALLPHAQPYNRSPFWYAGTDYASTIPSNVVDWVLVALHHPVTNVVVARRAGFLRADGAITDTDGESPLSFFVPTGSYHVRLHHRNHPGISLVVPVDFTSGSAICDFRTVAGGQKEVMPGIYAMYAGDINADQQVKYNGSLNDRVALLMSVGIITPNNILPNVYHDADVNMDGEVKYNGANNDRITILNTVGILTPNNIVVGVFGGI